MANIALYPPDTIDFSNQGYGVIREALTAISTEAASTTNGNITYEMVLTYPVDGPLASHLREPSLIRAQQSKDPEDYMIFEIYDYINDDAGIMTVYAEALPYRFLKIPLDNGGTFDTFPNPASALVAMQQVITGLPDWFHISYDGSATQLDFRGTPTKSKDTNGNEVVTYPSRPMYENIGAFIDAIVTKTGAKVKYGWNTIQIVANRGEDANVILRDDRNTSGVKIETKFSTVVNKIIPVLKVYDSNGNASSTETTIGKAVTPANPFQFISYWSGKAMKFDTQDDANKYFSDTKAHIPSQTVTVTPVMVDPALLTVNLFDHITVYNKRLGFTSVLDVNKKSFDLLSSEVTSFTLGNVQKTIYDSQAASLSAYSKKLEESISSNLLQHVVSANGKNTNWFDNEEPLGPLNGDKWFHTVTIDGRPVEVIDEYQDGKWVRLVTDRTGEDIAAIIDANELETQNAISAATSAADLAETARSEAADVKSAVARTETMAQSAIDLGSTASEAAQRASDGMSSLETSITKASNAASSAIASVGDELRTLSSNLTVTTENLKLTENKAEKALSSAGSLSKTISDVNMDIDDIKGSLELYATKTEIDNVNNSYTELSSSLKETAEGLKSKVDQTVFNGLSKELTSVSTTVTQLSNSYTIQNEQIKKIQTDMLGYASVDYVTQKLQLTSDSFTNEISEIKKLVNAQGQTNAFRNTEFTPDLEGWSSTYPSTAGRSIATDKWYHGSNGLDIYSSEEAKPSVTQTQFWGTWVKVDELSKLSASVYAEHLLIPTDGTYNQAALYLEYAAEPYDMEKAPGKVTQKPFFNWINSTKIEDKNKVYKLENQTVPEGMKYVTIAGRISGGNNRVFVSQPMLALGETTVGDYVPGGYDGTARYTKFQETLDGFSSEVGDINKGFSSTQQTVDMFSTKLSNLEGSVSTTKQTVDGFTNDISTANGKISTLQHTIDGFNNTVGDLNTGMSKVQQDITNWSVDISTLDGRVTTTEQTVNGFKTTLSTLDGHIIEFQQDIDGFKQTVSNISFGARNLLPQTAFEISDKWTANGTMHTQILSDSANSYGGHNSLRIYSDAGQTNNAIKGSISIPVYGRFALNEPLVLSFWARRNGTNAAQLHTELPGGVGSANLDISAGWHKYIVSGLKWSDASQPHNLYFWLTGGNQNVQISMPMLEYATLPSEWEPAPEDNVSTFTFSALQQTVDGFDAKIVGLASKMDLSLMESGLMLDITSVGSIPNQIKNSEFKDGDMTGWDITSTTVSSLWTPGTNYNDTKLGTGSIVYHGLDASAPSTGNATAYYEAMPIPSGTTTASFSGSLYCSSPSDGLKLARWEVWALDANINRIGNMGNVSLNLDKRNDVQTGTVENIQIPANAKYMQVLAYCSAKGGNVVFTQPMLVFSSKAGPYRPATPSTSQFYVLKDQVASMVTDGVTKSQLTETANQINARVQTIGTANLVYDSTFASINNWHPKSSHMSSATMYLTLDDWTKGITGLPEDQLDSGLGLAMNFTTMYKEYSTFESAPFSINATAPYSASGKLKRDEIGSGSYAFLELAWYKDAGKTSASRGTDKLVGSDINKPTSGFVTDTIKGVVPPSDAKYAAFRFTGYGRIHVKMQHPIIVQSAVVPVYTPDVKSAIAQINIDPTNILLSASKIHLSGESTIDDATIKSAMIDSLTANKLTAGTINAATINVINIDGKNISAHSITANQLQADAILVGINSNYGTTMNISPSQLNYISDGRVTAYMNSGGFHVSSRDTGETTGWMGSATYRFNNNRYPNYNGLILGVDSLGDFMAFGYAPSAGSDMYESKMEWLATAVAQQTGRHQGWHIYNDLTVHDKAELGSVIYPLGSDFGATSHVRFANMNNNTGFGILGDGGNGLIIKNDGSVWVQNNNEGKQLI